MRHARRNEPLVYVRELEGTDVSRLVELEEPFYPPELRGGVEFFDTLFSADWHEWPILYGAPRRGERPIRLGLGVGPELVGYIIARGCETEAGAPFLYIDYLTVLPGQRRHLMKLLRALFQQQARWYAGIPMVAHADEIITKLYERHRRAAERAGMTLARVEPENEWSGSQPLYRVEWEPCAARRVASPRIASGAAPALDAIGTVRANGAEYEVELARTVAQWDSLAEEWDRLVARVPGVTAFQTFGFLRLWWDHFAVSGSPFIVVLRRAGELAGIAPLAVFPWTIGHHAYRQLGFIGSRWEMDRPQFLFTGEAAETEACADALAHAIAARRDDWDLLYLYEQPPASTVVAALARSLRRSGYLVGELPDSTCPYIRTEGGWDAFLETRSRGFRKNLQRGRRRLERHGAVEYRVVNDPAAVNDAFARYLDVESRSWKADNDAGLYADAVDQAFYHDLTRLLGADRRIEFRFIEVAGEPAAGTFGIRHQTHTPSGTAAVDGDHFYSLKIAHDLRFAAASPGTLLESLEIRDCFEDGVVEYDFLGGFLTNKNRWTDDARTTTQVFAFPRRGRWIAFYIDRFVLRPRIKQALRRVGWLEPLLAQRDRVVRRIRKKEPDSS